VVPCLRMQELTVEPSAFHDNTFPTVVRASAASLGELVAAVGEAVRLAKHNTPHTTNKNSARLLLFTFSLPHLARHVSVWLTFLSRCRRRRRAWRR